jgi:hypothetical protein
MTRIILLLTLTASMPLFAQETDYERELRLAVGLALSPEGLTSRLSLLNQVARLPRGELISARDAVADLQLFPTRDALSVGRDAQGLIVEMRGLYPDVTFGLSDREIVLLRFAQVAAVTDKTPEGRATATTESLPLFIPTAEISEDTAIGRALLGAHRGLRGFAVLQIERAWGDFLKTGNITQFIDDMEFKAQKVSSERVRGILNTLKDALSSSLLIFAPETLPEYEEIKGELAAAMEEAKKISGFDGERIWSHLLASGDLDRFMRDVEFKLMTKKRSFDGERARDLFGVFSKIHQRAVGKHLENLASIRGEHSEALLAFVRSANKLRISGAKARTARTRQIEHFLAENARGAPESRELARRSHDLIEAHSLGSETAERLLEATRDLDAEAIRSLLTETERALERVPEGLDFEARGTRVEEVIRRVAEEVREANLGQPPYKGRGRRIRR